MTNLREQMYPLIREFQAANGRGNLLSANTTLIKMIELLMSHIETPQHFNTWMPNANAAASPAVGAGVIYSKNFEMTSNGVVVDLNLTPPVDGWEKFATTTTGEVNKTAMPFEIEKEIVTEEPEVKRKPGRPKQK